jgi:hypothetical protein
MAAVKKFNSNLLVQSTGISANITLDAETVYVDAVDAYISGNLHVAGVYDTTTVTNTNIQDKDIALNVGESGWGVGGNASPGTSGIIVDRGLQANVSLRWNETTDVWEITTDGSTYNDIITSSTGLSAVVDDTSPELGGNLVNNGYFLKFDDATISPPNASGTTIFTVGSSVFYADTVGSAGSGLYVEHPAAAAQELVTKAKAIVFAIIL